MIAGDYLTLTGEGFDTSAVVLPDICIQYITLSPTAITCIVANYESNFYELDVLVPGKGYAAVSQSPQSPGPLRNASHSVVSESPYPHIFLKAVVNSIDPSIGSLAGGTEVRINGTGFSHIRGHLFVFLGSAPCTISSSTHAQIVCISGSVESAETVEVFVTVRGYQAHSGVEYVYADEATPVIMSLSPVDVSEGDEIELVGENFGTNEMDVVVWIFPSESNFDVATVASSAQSHCSIVSVTDYQVICVVPAKPAGLYRVYAHVRGLGLAQGSETISYKLEITSIYPLTGGHGGGLLVTVSGNGFPTSTNSEDDPRITASCGGSQCTVVNSSAITNQLVCELDMSGAVNPFDDTTNCTFSLSYQGKEATAMDVFQYTSSLTPQLHSISPSVGGTAGGTLVTLTGNGFFPNGVTDPSQIMSADVVVTIDGALCEWYGRGNVSDTAISCRTEEHTTTLQAHVIVFVSGKGFSIESQGPVMFEYIDRWSSRFTWGGKSPPTAGDSVYIKQGQTVILDTNTPVLNLLLIEGTLLFDDDQNIHLQAKYIFINNGKLQVCYASSQEI